MGLPYIDLMIIHCPQPWAQFRADSHFFAENRKVWKALEDAYQAGKVRAIKRMAFCRKPPQGR